MPKNKTEITQNDFEPVQQNKIIKSNRNRAKTYNSMEEINY